MAMQKQTLILHQGIIDTCPLIQEMIVSTQFMVLQTNPCEYVPSSNERSC